MINKLSIAKTTFILVLMDQFLKWLMLNKFSSQVVENSGTVFGWVNSTAIGYWLLAIGLVALVWIIKNSDLSKPLYRWSIILIIAGALSNIIDRIWHGYIIDFISFFNLNHFNLADVYLFAGIIIYLWISFKKS